MERQNIEKVQENGDEDENIYECSHCSKRYGQAFKMFQHLEDKHDVELRILWSP